MNVSAHRAFSLLKEMAYERVSCSPAEMKAAERLLAECQAIGVDAHLEEFPVACGRVSHAKLVVTAPYTKEYECTGYECADCTPEGGLDAEFVYAEMLDSYFLPQCKDRIVMINGRLRRGDYEKLQKAGAKAIITYSGSVLDRLSESDCDERKLRDSLTDAFGYNVALNIRSVDAAEIVRRGATKMHIELQGERYTGTSHNVCAVIPGTTYPDEIISFGAHYDSVRFSTGVYDNLTGSVTIMEIMRYFAANPPARTIKFNWFGSEEQGLLGSKAWVAAHAEELPKHRLMINLDMNGTTLGSNFASVTGNKEAVNYLDGMMKEMGTSLAVRLDIMSSDCMPFADQGIPAVNFARYAGMGSGTAFIHDRRDNLKTPMLDERALNKTLQQTLYFTQRVANAPIFPIERKIDEEIVKKTNEYLFKTPAKA